MKKRAQQWIPNLLSLWRALSAGKLGILLLLPNHELWLAQILIVLGVLTDKLDGTLARRWQVESELGKKIESVADPLFVGSAAVYAYVVLDYPALLLFTFIGLGIIATVGRLLAAIITKQIFYKKSQITRYATFTAMLVIMLYIFQVPYREFIVWPAFAYGLFAAGNYIRLIVQFIRSEQLSIRQ